jgi:hypothetical protein
MTFSSPSGIMSIMTVGSFKITNCSFKNMSNSAHGLLIVSKAILFILQGCTFDRFIGFSFLVSYSPDYSLIANCLFSNITTPLQGVFRVSSGSNKSVYNSSFSSISGSIVLGTGSKLSTVNCSFVSFHLGPIFKLMSNSILSGSQLKLDRSCANQGGCVAAETNSSIYFSYSSLSNCVANGLAGAVFLDMFSLFNCTKCPFSISAATSGGAIYAAKFSTVILKDSLFSSNVVMSNGGAIALEGSCFVQQNVFNHNRAEGHGGIK